MNLRILEWLPLMVILVNVPWTKEEANMIDNLVSHEKSLQNELMNGIDDTKNICIECKNLLNLIQDHSMMHKNNPFQRNGNSSTPRDFLKQFCTSFLLADLSDDENLCDVIVDHYIPKGQTISRELRNFCNVSGVCEVTDKSKTESVETQLFSGVNTSKNKKQKSHNLFGSLVQPPMKALDWFRRGDLNLRAPWQRNRANSNTPITFVQISDIHLDLHYKQGSASHCRDKICCRKNTKGSGSAGKFGDYRCDAVKETVDTILANIAQLSPPPDFFIYVGDSPPHSNGMDETLGGKLADNKAINEILRQTLRGVGPIYPTLGNHDMFPENVYFSKGRNTKTILKELSTEWAALFPLDENQRKNIEDHGFYTTLVKDGLRILSINSLYAYRLNPLAFMSTVDPASRRQRQFIRKTLDDARINSEKVILMSHMKPSHINTYEPYTITMEMLVKEYQDVIILMLYGHEHTDTFVVSTDPLNRSKATGAFLAAPSITPYIYYRLGTNPSYRVFSLDKNTFQPLDYVQYYVDLQEANDKNTVSVKKQYRFTEEYNVPDLSSESFKIIADRISSDWNYYQKFERNKDVLVRRRKQCQKWNKFCRKKLTCETTSPTKLRFRLCLLNPLQK